MVSVRFTARDVGPIPPGAKAGYAYQPAAARLCLAHLRKCAATARQHSKKNLLLCANIARTVLFGAQPLPLHCLSLPFRCPFTALSLPSIAIPSIGFIVGARGGGGRACRLARAAHWVKAEV